MKLFKMVGCLAVLVAALFFWCNSSQAKDVVIGFTAPLSGPAAEYGLNCASGLDMAVKQINKTGGIKIKGKTYNLKLVKLDDGNHGPGYDDLTLSFAIPAIGRSRDTLSGDPAH